MTQFLISILIFAFLPSCTSNHRNKINYVGAQTGVVHDNKTSGIISISDTEAAAGIGPIEGLQGEITVLDGACYLATLNENHRPLVKQGCGGTKAPFFVWSTSDQYEHTTSLPDNAQVDQVLKILESNLRDHEVIKVKITGKVNNLDYHIIWKEGTGPHSMDEHHKSQKHFSLKDAHVTLIGFYSNKLKGVIGPKKTPLHLHFVSDDQKHSGHVESFNLDTRAKLSWNEE